MGEELGGGEGLGGGDEAGDVGEAADYLGGGGRAAQLVHGEGAVALRQAHALLVAEQGQVGTG